MYPPEFEYERAETVDEALALLAEHDGAETELLAGGHSLLPTVKSGLASPDVLIDIGRIEELDGIDRNGDSTTIGALTPYVEIESSADLLEDCTVIAETASQIGDQQVRNAGTIGGNLAHADPASDMPASVIAAGATIHAQGSDGVRQIGADDFFEGMFETALEPDELLTGIEVPHHGAGGASAYVKKPSPASGYAVVGVAATVHTADGTVESARVAANGATDRGIRLSPVEEALVDESLTDDAIAAAAARATDSLDGASLMDDNQASSEFRARLLEVYTERALEQVADRLST